MAGLRKGSAVSLQNEVGDAVAGARYSACSLNDLAENSDAILVFPEAMGAAIEESLTVLLQEIPEHETAFIALVPRNDPPQFDSKYCDPISSFICSSAFFRRFLDLGINCWAKTLCFAALRSIARGDVEVARLLVRQVPEETAEIYPQEMEATALVLPHRGDVAHLSATLKYLRRSIGGKLTVRVGLDVNDLQDYASFPAEFPDVEFHAFSPSPVGPYVIRQALAEKSSEPLLTLQDSDDLSCYDRFAVLYNALKGGDCDIVGSHELCLDEMRGLVQPVRFPLDCSAALKLCANHALLHATLMTRRETFFRLGGLSTDLIIANDTQFLLRAHFTCRIRNADRFLYIRRRHATSLTNAPETVFDNPLRRRLSGQWTRDFDLIKQGNLKIEDSTLRPVHRTEPWSMERFGVPVQLEMEKAFPR